MKDYLLLNNEIMRRENGFYQLDKDKEAVEAFQKEVDEKMMKFDSVSERFYWLINNNYYINFLIDYEMDFIERLTAFVEAHEFKFQSYMAISKFYQSYALKTNDKKHYLERYEDRIVAVALGLAKSNTKKAIELAQALIKQEYQPATPTFMNVGKKRGGEMVSCFLLEMDDSLNSINYNLGVAGQLSKIGGGVALNLSKLRGRNEAIQEVEGAASGVLPVLKLMEGTFNYVNQLGQRAGSGAGYLNVFHWDIEEFLDTKKVNADEKSRLQTLSIGVIVPNKFMELAEKGEKAYIFAPHTVYKATGQHLDDLDMNEWYDKLIALEDVKKREIDPRKLLTQIARTQFESGYPYVMYKDNANKPHALKELGQIKMSNLCCEIMQLQETSIINDYGEEDVIKRDISCNLGSLNLVNAMESDDFEQLIYTAMDALSTVSDLSNIKNAEGVRKANRELHSVGLGLMNLHGFLAKNKVSYESELAREFVDVFFEMVNFYSIKASCRLAIEKGETFKGFEQSEYANGHYFEKYTKRTQPKWSDKVMKLLGKQVEFIPSQSEWVKLQKDIEQFGLYNAYRLAIAPTGSISYIQSATPSIAPIVDVIERRTYGDSTTYYPMPYLAKDNFFFYKSAYSVDMKKYLELIAKAQFHIDQGISTILYVDTNTTTRELIQLYIYAWKLGLKSLYYTRVKNLDVTGECESCAV